VKQAIAAVRRPSLMNWAFPKSQPCEIYVSTSETQTAANVPEKSNHAETVNLETTLKQKIASTNEVKRLDELISLPSSSKQNFETEAHISNECARN